jgi:hypothetical protein
MGRTCVSAGAVSNIKSGLGSIICGRGAGVSLRLLDEQLERAKRKISKLTLLRFVIVFPLSNPDELTLKM